jgi:hypothetical protein
MFEKLGCKISRAGGHLKTTKPATPSSVRADLANGEWGPEWATAAGRDGQRAVRIQGASGCQHASALHTKVIA